MNKKHTLTHRTNAKAREKTREVLFIVSVCILATGLYCFFQSRYTSDGNSYVACISRDGKVIKTIDLSSVDKPYEIHLEDARGTNVIKVDKGRICVLDADCPNQICVNTGWIDRPGHPIACIPHGLLITIEQTDGSDYDLEAISH